MALTIKYLSADGAQKLNWTGLERGAVEAAPFALSAMLLPKLALGDKVIGLEDGADLHLALPIRSALKHDAVAWSDLTASSLPHFTTPEAVNALVEGLNRPLLLPQLPLESAFFEALQNSGARLGIVKQWQRAAITFEGNYDDWHFYNFDTKRRKEFRRLWARLIEQGSLIFTTLSKVEDAAPWIERFLSLEAKGWKGNAGTALANTTRNRELFTKACLQLHQGGHLRFWALQFAGKPIAMLFGIVERDEAAIVKIAYDEAFAKYSPGVLLLLQATRAMFGEGLKRADSCAAPNHPMIDHLWRERLDFADVLIASPLYPRAKFVGLHTTLALARGARTVAKRILRH